MRLDAHQHYWKLERNDYGWLTPELGVLYQDYLPNHLRANLKRQRIDKTIIVQAAPTIEETKFLLDLAAREPTAAGVVGWLDLDAAAYKEQYFEFRKNPLFVGFRIMIQDMEDAHRLLQPHMVEALRFFAEQDFPVDLLLREHQLPIVIRLLEQVPNLRGVIDHMAKPHIAKGQMEPWKRWIAQVAAHETIYCKLSGMVTEAEHQHWTMDDFIPYVHHVVNVFGSRRLMFGSDWPVCTQAASYDDVVNILNHALPSHLSEAEVDNIFGPNAVAFYKLQSLTENVVV